MRLPNPQMLIIVDPFFRETGWIKILLLFWIRPKWETSPSDTKVSTAEAENSPTGLSWFPWTINRDENQYIRSNASRKDIKLPIMKSEQFIRFWSALNFIFCYMLSNVSTCIWWFLDPWLLTQAIQYWPNQEANLELQYHFFPFW